jgi:hypothetical protein
MFNSKTLTEEQKKIIHQWAAEGSTMAEIQKRINDELKISITYMDARFLILDLGITLIAPSVEEEKKEEVVEEIPEPTGFVSVVLDQIVIPGMLFSGKVVFSDGEKAMWYVTQEARLGFEPSRAGYRPSEEDANDFQTQLREMIK